MTDLWEPQREARRESAAPLAVRMRPRTLDEFVGQSHILGPGKLLRRMLEADRLTSVIFYGPPGTGKTTLAEVCAAHTRSRFERANAASVGVREVRDVLDRARRALENEDQRTIFFLDELHRFNRAQQDVLLGDVERGIVTLIGATTENPYFSVNAPLISRSQIFQFEPLKESEIVALLRRTIADRERGLGDLRIEATDEALRHWAKRCDGDARRAMTALEIAVRSGGRATESRAAADAHAAQTKQAGASVSESPADAPEQSPPAGEQANRPMPIVVDLEVAEDSIQRKAIVYDKAGDAHYDAASALIKSVRGSDPDATLYWLAKMLTAGEDPMFIARRLAILASEDIGNADPRAIQVAASAYTITERIGMPECQLTLGQAAVYLATAPKSNASAVGIWTAMRDAREGRTVPVPRFLRDGHYAGAKQLGHAEGYRSAHEGEGGWVDQDYLGVEKTYYTPTDRGHEKRIGEFLAWIESRRREAENARSSEAEVDTPPDDESEPSPSPHASPAPASGSDPRTD